MPAVSTLNTQIDSKINRESDIVVVCNVYTKIMTITIREGDGSEASIKLDKTDAAALIDALERGLR